MGNFIYELNKRLDKEEQFFKLSEALIEGDRVTVTLLVPSVKFDEYLSEKPGYDRPLRSKLYAIASGILPDGMTIKIKFKKTETSESQVRKAVGDYIATESRLLSPKINGDDVYVKINPGEFIEVVISVSKPVLDFCKNSAFPEKLQDYLDKQFMESSEVVLKDVYQEEAITITDVAGAPQHIMNYQMKEALLGNITRRAKYIKDVLATKSEYDRVCVTGKIVGWQVKDWNKHPELKYFLFRLDDTTGAVMDVKYFPKTVNQVETMLKLKDNDKVVVEGRVGYDTYYSKYTMTLYSVALIDIDFEKAITDIKYLPVPKSYTVVKPEPYKEEVYENLSMFESVEKDLPPILADNDFVVFDTETTGLNSDVNKVIEIAGVKVSKGKLVETFSTFVNPQEKLTREIIELTNITQDMVDRAPAFNRVIGDFYKFCNGCSLVAHNAPFDMGFIVGRARDVGYKFDNTVYDTLTLSRQIFPQFKKFNLGYLCGELDISLEGAHRAINDAIATAKLFILIAKKIEY